MKYLISIASVLVVILFLIFIIGYRRNPTSNMDKSKIPTPDTPYIKVYISKSGEITLDDKATTLEDVGVAFAALAQKNGVVLYTRESPEDEPHPIAKEVTDLVIQNRLPIQMCRNRDCSDALESNGKLRIGN